MHKRFHKYTAANHIWWANNNQNNNNYNNLINRERERKRMQKKRTQGYSNLKLNSYHHENFELVCRPSSLMLLSQWVQIPNCALEPKKSQLIKWMNGIFITSYRYKRKIILFLKNFFFFQMILRFGRYKIYLNRTLKKKLWSFGQILFVWRENIPNMRCFFIHSIWFWFR